MNRFFDDYYGDAFEMEEFMTKKQKENLMRGKLNISHLIPGDEFFYSQGYKNYTSDNFTCITKDHISNFYK